MNPKVAQGGMKQMSYIFYHFSYDPNNKEKCNTAWCIASITLAASRNVLWQWTERKSWNTDCEAAQALPRSFSILTHHEKIQNAGAASLLLAAFACCGSRSRWMLWPWHWPTIWDAPWSVTCRVSPFILPLNSAFNAKMHRRLTVAVLIVPGTSDFPKSWCFDLILNITQRGQGVSIPKSNEVVAMERLVFDRFISGRIQGLIKTSGSARCTW